MTHMTAGRRNLLQQIARSRMARDVRTVRRHIEALWMFWAMVVGMVVLIVSGIQWAIALLGG